MLYTKKIGLKSIQKVKLIKYLMLCLEVLKERGKKEKRIKQEREIVRKKLSAKCKVFLSFLLLKK